VSCDRNHDGPDQQCVINNIAAPVRDQIMAIEIQLPNMMVHPTLTLSFSWQQKTMVFCSMYKH